MADEITQDQLDAAEKDFLEVKASDDEEAKTQSAQAFADLRRAWKLQEEAAGRRSAGNVPVVSNNEE